MLWGPQGATARVQAGQEASAEDTFQTAEETRTERLVQWRLARRDSLEWPDRGLASRLLARAEESRILKRLPDINLYGFQPRFGGIVGGAGATFGVRFNPEYRLGTGWDFFVEGLVSSRRYWQGRLLARDVRGRVVAFGFLRFRHLPQEAWYGAGHASVRADESDYRYDEFLTGALYGLRPARRFTVGAQLGFLVSRTGEGRHAGLPDIEALFGPDDVPGFRDPMHFLVSGVFAEWDARDQRDDAHAVRSYSLADQSLRGLSFDANSGVFVFTELIHRLPLGGRSTSDVDPGFLEGRLALQEYIPMKGEMLGFAFQQVVSYAIPTDGDGGIVPFHMLPSIGGRSSLRGYDDLRFRGRGFVLANAEYRWQVWHFMDLAVFVDGGQVFRRAAELAPANAAVSYGAGVRLKRGTLGSGQDTLVRFDVAWSEEGVRPIFTFGGAF